MMKRGEGSASASLPLLGGDDEQLKLTESSDAIRNRPSLDHEHCAWAAGHEVVAGVDEVGRGALAGPVVAAAVVLRDDQACWQLLATVRDSKVLKPRVRREQSVAIRAAAAGVGLGAATAAEIDAAGIVRATELAMLRAVAALPTPPTFLLVDGFRLRTWPHAQEALVKGDRRVLSIAAASVVAKVARDAEMVALAQAWPGYGFERHKGYGTAQHLAAIRDLGPTEQHRLTWSPLRAIGAKADFGSLRPVDGAANRDPLPSPTPLLAEHGRLILGAPSPPAAAE